jgi:hypothetical protein
MATSALRYRAFISYASADRVIGETFQRAIESYRIPKALRGADRGFGPIPKRLTPLFRDRSDADVGGALPDTLGSALARSDALIVLCSPIAAQSKWVNAEIRKFKELGRGARILPVIVDGTPRRFDAATATDGALPPELFADPDGHDAARNAEVSEQLAADLRPQGDGFDFAKLKVVGYLTGVPLTELTQRHLEAERRERRNILIVAGLISTLSIAAATAAVIAYSAEREARRRLTQAIDIAAARIDEAGRFGDEYGASTEVITSLLAQAEQDFEKLGGTGQASEPVLEVQRGRLLALFAHVFGKVGEREKEMAHARRAKATLERVVVQRRLLAPSTWLAALPSRGEWTAATLDALLALSTALTESDNRADVAEGVRLLEEGRELANREKQDSARFWSQLSELHYFRTELNEAIVEKTQAIELREAQRRANPSADHSQLAFDLSRRAEFLLESERPVEAIPDHKAALAILEPLAAAKPNDGNVHRTLAITLTQYADALYAVCGSWTASMPHHERSVQLLRGLHAADPARLDNAAYLAVALEHLGDSRLQQEAFGPAADAFTELLAIREHLFARDRQNPDARRGLALAYERQGTLAFAQHSKAAAGWFDRQRRLLSEGDEPVEFPDPVLRRDIANAWNNTAKAIARFDRGGPWEPAHKQAIQIMGSLVAQKDALPGWQRDLAIFHTTYGESLRHVARLGDARTQWSIARDLIEAQLEQSPNDPRLLSDLDFLKSSLGLTTDRRVSAPRTLPAGCEALK